ncbi:MAG TPA: LCP family protein [Leptolyngbyaceae cyanobacterium M65_K2018_010]|nr:LCP family protein [Leptolyngbyaceae cyanobacterium M65_K2018_010]
MASTQQVPLGDTPNPKPNGPPESPPSQPPVGQSQRRGLGRALQVLLWSGLLVGAAATSALVGAGLALFLPLPEFMVGESRPAMGLGDLWKSGFRYQVTRPVNILVMGIDEVLDAPAQSEAIFSGRTDTLLLVRLNPQDKTLKVMSIPRDTRVQIPGYGMAKINQANVEGGPELVAETLADNLGNVQIDRYVRVNTTAFREIVDLIGGIEVEVPKRMQYTDKTQGLYIDLYPGWQTLNGDQAEQFARFRNADGDIGRVQRQQMLLRAFRERLTHPTVMPKLPQAIRLVQRYIDTNLTLEEMLALANFGLETGADELQMVMLPGRFSGPAEYEASYWLPDWEASATILQNFFQTHGVGVYADHSGRHSGADLRIAIQNASGTSEVGATVAHYLAEQGFSNVYVVSNWPTTASRTEVIAQKGDLESARWVQSLLGTGRVVSDSTGDLRSDLTIRVGQDWVEQSSSPPAPRSF